MWIVRKLPVCNPKAQVWYVLIIEEASVSSERYDQWEIAEEYLIRNESFIELTEMAMSTNLLWLSRKWASKGEIMWNEYLWGGKAIIDDVVMLLCEWYRNHSRARSRNFTAWWGLRAWKSSVWWNEAGEFYALIIYNDKEIDITI